MPPAANEVSRVFGLVDPPSHIEARGCVYNGKPGLLFAPRVLDLEQDPRVLYFVQYSVNGVQVISISVRGD